MGKETVVRDKPPLLRQPLGSAKCWAYSMSSWMKVSGRTPTSPEAIISASTVFTNPDTRALFPDKFPNVAESTFIRMGWKILKGKDLDWDEMRDLLDVGWVYAILDSGATAMGGTHFSHARVIYGASADSRWGGAVMNTMDPILGDYDWPITEVKTEKLMLGFAADLLTSDEIAGRRPWMVRTAGGVEQTRWCPKG